jgi:hypothetical protein
VLGARAAIEAEIGILKMGSGGCAGLTAVVVVTISQLGRSTSMRRSRHLVIVLCLAGCGSCVSLNSSARDVIGRWQVECDGGKETLDLRPGGRYVYTIESPRRRVKVDGAWTIEPARGWSDSTHIILRNAPQTCEGLGVFKSVAIADNTLDPVWEWGHTELSFNPDFGGFRRIGSSR